MATVDERFSEMMRAFYRNPEYAGWDGVRVLWAEGLLRLFPPPMWEAGIATLNVPEAVKEALRADSYHPLTFRVRGDEAGGYRLVVGDYHMLILAVVQNYPEPRQEQIWDQLWEFAERTRAAYAEAMVEAYAQRAG